MRQGILLIAILLNASGFSFTQEYQLRNQFTTQHGLSSNHIYNMAEDDKGFLWVASDNGLNRFDGQHFKLFSIKDGLPTNDIIQVLVDGKGVVWANCFQHSPHYFDEALQQFFPVPNIDSIKYISGNVLLSYHLPNGRIRFFNERGRMDCYAKRCDSVSKQKYYSYVLLTPKNQNVFLDYFTGGNKNEYKLKPYTLYIKRPEKDNYIRPRPRIYNNSFYHFSHNKEMVQTSVLSANPVVVKSDTMRFSYDCRGFTVCGNKLLMFSSDHTVYIYSGKMLEDQVKINTPVSDLYLDSKENLWLSTINNGIIQYTKNSITHILQNTERNNFLSVAVDSAGTLYAGNHFSEVVIKKDKIEKTIVLESKLGNFWTRKICCESNKVLVISDNGYSLNLKPYLGIGNQDGNKLVSLKSAEILNDSIAIIGSNTGLLRLNLLTQQYRIFKEGSFRITDLTKANAQIVYYICSNGLFKYNDETKVIQQVHVPHGFKNELFSKLSYDEKGLLWISNETGDLAILKNDQWVSSIPNTKTISDNITAILARNGKVWIGSKNGLSLVRYHTTPTFSYTISNILKSDGLPAQNVQDIYIHNAKVYVATDNGIAILPEDFIPASYEVLPYLSEVKVNQRRRPLQHIYKLKSNENYIELDFVGVEINGHFKNIIYALDDSSTWSRSESNRLNLQLSHGEHILYVRALGENNKPSTKLLRYQFNVETPFYKHYLFWILFSGIISALAVWMISARKREREEIKFKQQLALEEQRKKITADLHDDIGASLSSLQINSAVANQLIGKDDARAKSVLKKIEVQTQNMADKIGDIIWSMKPGKEEFMTLGNRIKTFANDILGSTEIHYKIGIDEELNVVVKDIFLRKNIVLIVKEAVNNAVKYSGCTQLEISLKKANRNIIIEVRDNGVGFDVNQPKGNGLNNMRNRTEELNGSFTINSSEDGTAIRCVIPIVV